MEVELRIRRKGAKKENTKATQIPHHTPTYPMQNMFILNHFFKVDLVPKLVVRVIMKLRFSRQSKHHKWLICVLEDLEVLRILRYREEVA